jgi:glycerol-3-phosphate dehydrogenase
MVVWTYSGVRPLYDDGASRAQEATRDYVLDVETGAGQAPILSVFGGKITTARRLAEHALEKLAPYLKVGKPWTAGASLPGGNFPVDGGADVVRALRAAYPFVAEAHAWRLVSAYGTRAPLFLAGTRSMADLGHVFGADLTEAEVAWLMQEEWARTPDDILWRRTKLGLRFTGPQIADLDDWMAEARQHVALPVA